jgi:replicative DNA helicase
VNKIAGRVPPHSLDAEAAVLSAALLDAGARDTALEMLEKEHFYSTANQLVFKAIAALHPGAVDIVSAASWLRDREVIQKVGGVRYLAQLVDATPAVSHVSAHAAIVKEKWRLRELIKACQRFAAEGYGDTGPVQEFIDEAEQAMYQIARVEAKQTIVRLRDALVTTFTQISERAQADGDSIVGIPTSFIDLDKKTAGLHTGDLTIVAARPGMGKTTWVLNVAVNVASTQVIGHNQLQETITKPGHSVAFFSLEMPKEQLCARIVCTEARVDLGKLRQGYLSQEEWQALTGAATALGSLPIWIDDSPALSLLELRGKVRRLKADIAHSNDPELGLVAVDYLQLMQGRKGVKSREQEISEISRGLKAMAKELEVPVIALSQLNRGVETRGGKDKRPLLADLRESGAIEQDADTIIFIYRDEYYNRETTSDKGMAELIIAKQRNGPTGTVKVRFVANYTRFDNLAPGEYDDFDDYG